MPARKSKLHIPDQLVEDRKTLFAHSLRAIEVKYFTFVKGKCQNSISISGFSFFFGGGGGAEQTGF